jgi:hypothetical protein
MIVRIWRTQIDQARADEYLDFAQSRSLPMFRAEPGFAGVLFAAREAERAVITLWDRATWQPEKGKAKSACRSDGNLRRR